MHLIYILIVGAIAGWLAGLIQKGHGFGVLTNILVGVVGSVIGHFLFGILGFDSTNLIGDIAISTVGALVLVWCLRFV